MILKMKDTKLEIKDAKLEKKKLKMKIKLEVKEIYEDKQSKIR